MRACRVVRFWYSSQLEWRTDTILCREVPWDDHLQTPTAGLVNGWSLDWINVCRALDGGAPERNGLYWNLSGLHPCKRYSNLDDLRNGVGSIPKRVHWTLWTSSGGCTLPELFANNPLHRHGYSCWIQVVLEWPPDDVVGLHMPVWWNRQTCETQNLVVETPCGFDPHHRHQWYDGLKWVKGFGLPVISSSDHHTVPHRTKSYRAALKAKSVGWGGYSVWSNFPALFLIHAMSWNDIWLDSVWDRININQWKPTVGLNYSFYCGHCIRAP